MLQREMAPWLEWVADMMWDAPTGRVLGSVPSPDAFQGEARACADMLASAAADCDRRGAAVDYTALFCGVRPDAPHPYESVYANEGGLLAQAASAEVGRAYVEAGFDPSHDGANEPCDHISTELRFAAFLLKRGGEDDVPVLERFLAEHLGLWAPRLGRKISACAQTPVYRALGEMLESALFA